MFATSFEPKTWSEALSGLPPAIAVLAAVAIALGFVLVLWRGSEKLGIPGAGVEIRLAREALERDLREGAEERRKEHEALVAHFKAGEESDRRTRRDLRSVMAWLAATFAREPPPPLDDPDDSDPSIVPPPPATVRGGSSPDLVARAAPTSRRDAARASRPR